jgi:hypothetical protein
VNPIGGNPFSSLSQEQRNEAKNILFGNEMESDNIALKSALLGAPVEKPIELEMKMLESETRSESTMVFDRENNQMVQKFTQFKPVITRDMFLAKIDTSDEFFLHEQNVNSALVCQYLSNRRSHKMDPKTGVPVWYNRGINYQVYQENVVAYKDARLALTRSVQGWYGELMRTNIVQTKKMGNIFDEYKLIEQQQNQGLSGWVKRLMGRS